MGSAVREDARGSVPQEVPPLKRLVVGITGATGSIYGIRLLEILRGQTDVQTHLVISAPGKRTIVEETAYTVRDVEALYAARFPDYDAASMSAYRFYVLRPRRLKVFDEHELGAGVFVTARLARDRRPVWERTDIYRSTG